VYLSNRGCYCSSMASMNDGPTWTIEQSLSDRIIGLLNAVLEKLVSFRHRCPVENRDRTTGKTCGQERETKVLFDSEN